MILTKQHKKSVGPRAEWNDLIWKYAYVENINQSTSNSAKCSDDKSLLLPHGNFLSLKVNPEDWRSQ